MSEDRAAAKKAHDDLQARLHATQAEPDAAKTNSSASAKAPDCSNRRIPAVYISDVYFHLIS